MLNAFPLETQQVDVGSGDKTQPNWRLVEVIDSAESDIQRSDFPSCEQCGKEGIRFVHVLEDNFTGENRRVGSECSRLLTSNSVMVAHLERLARNTAASKARFLRSVQWETLAGGNVRSVYKRYDIFLRRLSEDIFEVSINGTYRISACQGLHAAKMAAYHWII
jgi:hypothetical protein